MVPIGLVGNPVSCPSFCGSRAMSRGSSSVFSKRSDPLCLAWVGGCRALSGGGSGTIRGYLVFFLERHFYIFHSYLRLVYKVMGCIITFLYMCVIVLCFPSFSSSSTFLPTVPPHSQAPPPPGFPSTVLSLQLYCHFYFTPPDKGPSFLLMIAWQWFFLFYCSLFLQSYTCLFWHSEVLI